eukprot:gene6352-6585_t
MKMVHALQDPSHVQAKRKYQEAVQARNAVDQDNQELQQKYTQKAMQYRKLAEMFKQLQQENAELKRRQGIAGGAVMGTGNSGRSNVTQFGGGGGTTQMVCQVTTVQHQRSIIELSPQSGTNGLFLQGHGSTTAGGQQTRGQRPPIMGTAGIVGGNGSGGATFGNMFATGNSPNLGALLGSTSAQQPRRPGTSGGMFAAGNRASAGAAGGMRGLGPGTGLLGSPAQGIMSL